MFFTLDLKMKDKVLFKFKYVFIHKYFVNNAGYYYCLYND